MLEIRLKSGDIYTNFLSGEVYIDIEALVGSFSFTSTFNILDKTNYTIRLNDYVEILVDGKQIINGFIERLESINDTDRRVIRVSGRGLLCDLIDTNLLERKEFKGQYKLESICRNILNEVGFTSRKIINNAGEIEDFTDVESIEIGATAFGFLEKLAKSRQIFLNSDEYGNLVFTRGQNGNAPDTLRSEISSNTNNILNSYLSLNSSNRFYKYVLKSTLNEIDIEEDVDASVIVNQIGIVIDNEIRNTRILEMITDKPMNDSECRKRAIWESNIRRIRGFEYKCSIQGYSVNNNLWKVNRLVSVIDDFSRINSILLIKSIEYKYSLDAGSISNITCVPKDAYTLQAQIDQYDSSTETNSSPFISEMSDEILDEILKRIKK